jgi:AcrR family transcriptional regulator
LFALAERDCDILFGQAEAIPKGVKERDMATRKRISENDSAGLEERIVDAVITLAEEVGWENVRLRIVAQRLDVSLAEMGSHFRDLDAVADAWFARARQAMLAPVPPEFASLPARQRLETLLLRWFDATSAHRRISVQMLAGKLWPFHPHHWAPLIFNLSRTILWLRDAAALDAGSPRRELEEVGLTWLFLLTLFVWAGDESEGQARTRRFLQRRLADADVLMTLLFGPQPPTGAIVTR